MEPLHGLKRTQIESKALAVLLEYFFKKDRSIWQRSVDHDGVTLIIEKDNVRYAFSTDLPKGIYIAERDLCQDS